MNDALRVEIRVRGRLGRDLHGLLRGLDVRLVPRHTVIRMGSCDVRDLRVFLEALERKEIEVEQVIT